MHTQIRVVLLLLIFSGSVLGRKIKNKEALGAAEGPIIKTINATQAFVNNTTNASRAIRQKLVDDLQALAYELVDNVKAFANITGKESVIYTMKWGDPILFYARIFVKFSQAFVKKLGDYIQAFANQAANASQTVANQAANASQTVANGLGQLGKLF